MFSFVIVIVVFPRNSVELTRGPKYLGQCLNVTDTPVCKFDLSFYWLTDRRLVNAGYRFGGNHGARCHALLGDENNAQTKEKRTVTHFMG